MNYSAITIQGNIISGEILEKIRTETDDFKYQGPKDFGFEKRSDLRDAIGNAWAEARTLWDLYIAKIDKLPEGDAGTSLTRKFWMVPLLYELGYDLEKAESETVAERSFNISHRAQNLDQYPVLIMGHHQKLDAKPEARILRISPHALVQEYLNYTEHLYGLVTNGRSLRMLRDSNRITKLAYLEFDLERMMEEDLYHEFALMYRILHASRMPKSQDEVEKSIIEQYHQESIESGARIREKLRQAVEEAMTTLAGGLLSNQGNGSFNEAVMHRKMDPLVFYRILLRVMYRIIFLATIEERDLVYPEVPDDRKKEQHRLKRIYEQYYSLNRLRNLALAPVYIDPRKDDLWQGLMATFRLFEPMGEGEKLGILPLGGELFGKNALSNDEVDLYSLRLDNRNFMEMISKLTLFRDSRGIMTRVNYRDLNVEELGSIYESLLELHPYFDTKAARPAFGFSYGSERKTTGSYYTRHDLVAQLIKSALIPVMEERVATSGWNINKKGHEKEAEAAILDIKVCDPAAGSGHFLLAASRVLAFQLARVRTGEENPGDDPYMHALRDVIEHCIYGVDLNPPAVELCRLSLWLIGHNKGKPLTFLEHKIKCGNSLVGLDSLDRLPDGIPDGAFKPLTGDDKAIAAQFKKLNASYVKGGQFSLFQAGSEKIVNQEQLTLQYKHLSDRTVDSINDFEWKRKQYNAIRTDPAFRKAWNAANLFTYAFFQPYLTDQEDKDTVTTETIGNFIASKEWENEALIQKVEEAAEAHHFFHWSLEFPDVFDKGGFDVMLGNPPWEIIELKEKEFFANKNKAIAEADNKDKRIKLIDKLKISNPDLHSQYQDALHDIDATRRFIQGSGVLSLAIWGRTNTYSVFSELNLKLLNNKGRGGILVPTGIATDDTNKEYFAFLVENNRLVSLFDFENRKALFPGVHRSYKFCLLTFSGSIQAKDHQAQFGFFLHDVLDLLDDRRVFTLKREDFLNINPNTKTCPIFRTRQDAELTKKIYSYVSVLINEEKGWNPWGVTFRQGLFNMSSDSHLFKTAAELEAKGFSLKGNRFVKGDPPFEGKAGEMWLPLYEAKMIWHFDHRFGTYEGVDSRTSTQTPTPTLEQYQNTEYMIKPWYWVEKENVNQLINNKIWFFGFRDITNSTNDRSFISSIVPFSAISNKKPILFFEDVTNLALVNLFSSLCSLAFDYIVRQKIGGTSMNFFLVRQFPVLTYSYQEFNLLLINYYFELIYTSHDIKAFADDLWKEADIDLRKAIFEQWKENKAETGGHEWVIPEWYEAYPEIHWHSPMEEEGWSDEDLLGYNEGCPLPPFKWDEERRAQLKVELDAYFALLYGLERDELRYILDPQDVYGEDFPGETFRVLKEKEIKKYGEYRTRRLVLEAWDALEAGALR